ncbi:MAG: Mo-dependent nitrogenase C-terminal domain-containing protein [Waterburya sp.]
MKQFVDWQSNEIDIGLMPREEFLFAYLDWSHPYLFDFEKKELKNKLAFWLFYFSEGTLLIDAPDAGLPTSSLIKTFMNLLIKQVNVDAEIPCLLQRIDFLNKSELITLTNIENFAAQYNIDMSDFAPIKMAIAHLFLKLVPLRCPFAKYLNGFELCRLNPFYPQIMDLRHRAELYIEKNAWMETKTYL